MSSFASAGELAAAIRLRELSATEALEEHLERVRERNGPLNAVIALDEGNARAAAEAADRALAVDDRELGPLHGVPMTIKDSWETAGLVTTCGAPELAEHVPARDAVAVARLRGAGAIVFGKTNAPLMAGDVQTYNEVHGTTNNPWDLTRTSGGSSGGAAVALATGMTPLELGSDIGGSIRTPSSWCGVYGHKPSWGVVPLRGHIPGPPGTLGEPDLGVGGPMARDPRDLALALDVLAGPGDWDASAWRLELPPPRATALSDFRVAAWLDDERCPVDPAVRAVLEAAVEALRRAGTAVDEAARPSPSLAQMDEAYFPLLGAIIGAGLPPEAYDGMREAASALRAGDQSPIARFARAMTSSAREMLRRDEARNRQRGAWQTFFADVDVILMPCVAVPAIPHDNETLMPMRMIDVGGTQRTYLDLFTWIAPATSCHLPATAAPVGRTPGGLPVGVQVVGPHLEDRTTIAFAQALTDAGIAAFAAPPPATVAPGRNP